MNSFEKWVKDEWPSLSYYTADQAITKRAYIAGLRRAAEIAEVYWHLRRGIPDDARVIVYHGRPKPWEIDQ